MTINRSLTFAEFWAKKEHDGLVLIDRILIYRVSIFIAYLVYKFGGTPNQITVASCGFGCLSGLIALVLGTDDAVSSVIILYALAQSAYILDCADGQLARCTQRTSPFGAFLDHGLDIISSTVAFGGFFAYLYRYFGTANEPQLADLALLVGFCFLAAQTSRFFALENFKVLLERELVDEKTSEGPSITLAKCLMDHQVSVFNMLVFLISPTLCLFLFFIQSVLLFMAYFRYFWRAYRLLHSED